MPTERAQEKNVVLCPNVFSHCREALNILCRSCSIVYLEKKKKKKQMEPRSRITWVSEN